MFALHWERHRFCSGPFAPLIEGAESSNLIMLLGGPVLSRGETDVVREKLLLEEVQYLRSFLLLRMVKHETVVTVVPEPGKRRCH